MAKRGDGLSNYLFGAQCISKTIKKIKIEIKINVNVEDKLEKIHFENAAIELF